jgi:predicted ATPase
MAQTVARPELLRQLRRALASLYDPASLRSHPVATLLADCDSAGPALQNGAALHQRLLEAIEALRPGTDHAHRFRTTWRAHSILRLRYVEMRDAPAVQRELSISKSQYYREHDHAVAALAAILVEGSGVRAGGRALDEVATRQHAAFRIDQSLPTRLTSFVGRRRELADVKRLVADHRLVTLVGFGGAGKSRLGLEAAGQLREHFADGVCLAELASLVEPDLVVQTVAFSLGIHERPGESLLQTLTAAVAARHVLILLDNCEHLVAACRQLIEPLLRSCPHLHILATSRVVLAIAGEIVWDVPPLDAPSLESIAITEGVQCESVQLFLERAASVRRGFVLTDQNALAVARICYLVEGIPLAIELAAARIKVLSPHQLAQRIDDRFQVLTAGWHDSLPQHQTLRAMVDWSFDLLAERERALLRRLCVFAGGWTLEAAESVCADDPVVAADVLDVLTALTDNSLVHVRTMASGEIRYSMLETLRQYTTEQLDREAERRLRDRHFEYFAGLVRQCEPLLESPEQIDTLDRLEVEHNNLRIALAHAGSAQYEPNRAAEMAAILGLFWFIRNYFGEGLQRLTGVLSLATEETGWTIRCRAVAAFFTASLKQHADALPMFDEAVALARQHAPGLTLAWVVGMQAASDFLHGHAASMEAAAREATAMSIGLGWAWGAAVQSAYVGRARLLLGDTAEAIAWFDQAQEYARRAGDPFSNAMVLSFQGTAASTQHDFDRAISCFDQSLVQFRQLGSVAHASRILVDLAVAASAAGRAGDAAQALREGFALAHRLGAVPYRFIQLLAVSARVLAQREQCGEAAVILAAVASMRASAGSQLPPEAARQEDALLLSLRKRLADDQFDRALTEGQTLSQDEATELAVRALANT